MLEMKVSTKIALGFVLTAASFGGSMVPAFAQDVGTAGATLEPGLCINTPPRSLVDQGDDSEDAWRAAEALGNRCYTNQGYRILARQFNPQTGDYDVVALGPNGQNIVLPGQSEE
jgi:hypothetical protein